MNPMIKQAVRPGRTRASFNGVSLIEALVAMAIMAFGMLAVVGVQVTLRANADIAKQRSEATRIAEANIEMLRSFVGMSSIYTTAGQPIGWDDITTMPAPVNVVGENATYTVTRTANVISPSETDVVVAVTWQDRNQANQQVTLSSVLAGAEPALSGVLSVPPIRTAANSRSQRHPTIPVRAGMLGNGESAFKPAEAGTVAWTFNNTTGVITRVCTVNGTSTSTTLVAADLATANCAKTNAQLLSGVVRFNLRGGTEIVHGNSVIKPIPAGTVAWVIGNSTSQVLRTCQVSASKSTSDLDDDDVKPSHCTAIGAGINVSPFDPTAGSISLVAADSENPVWPQLPLSVSLALTSTGHSQADQCVTNGPAQSVAAASDPSGVEYYCIVYPNAQGTWSGASSIAPGAFSDAGAATWAIGSSSSKYKVCRYTPSSAASQTNVNHPAAYTDVLGNLVNQNFLVIVGNQTCPTDTPADPASGNMVNSNTMQQQP